MRERRWHVLLSPYMSECARRAAGNRRVDCAEKGQLTPYSPHVKKIGGKVKRSWFRRPGRRADHVDGVAWDKLHWSFVVLGGSQRREDPARTCAPPPMQSELLLDGNTCP